jgi:hypothetical protein
VDEGETASEAALRELKEETFEFNSNFKVVLLEK